MNDISPQSENLRRTHPLAIALAERLRGSRARVLELGAGRGRNTAALRAAGFQVEATADDAQPPWRTGAFDAALSTHALLHGTPEAIARRVAAIAQALTSGAPFYATFGSKRDARHGHGRKVDRDTYAPESGEEAGVAHAFFEEAGLRALLEPLFVVESLEETPTDEIVGAWAHPQRPRGSVHWFLRAISR